MLLTEDNGHAGLGNIRLFPALAAAICALPEVPWQSQTPIGLLN